MAKVTITFEDMDDGVSLTVQSDPPFPEKGENEALAAEQVSALSDAQQMALHMTMLFDQQMQGEEEQQTAHEHHKCCGRGGCGKKQASESKAEDQACEH